MKKLLFLILFLPLTTLAQNTVTLPSGTTATTVQTRYLGTDSLKRRFDYTFNGYNEMYTATQINKLFRTSGSLFNKHADSLFARAVDLYNPQTIGGDKTAAGNWTYTGVINVRSGSSYPYVGMSQADGVYSFADANNNVALYRGYLAFTQAGTPSAKTLAIKAPVSISSGGRVQTLQDKDGTIALLGDVPSAGKLDSTYTAKTPVYGTIYNKATPILADFTANGVTASTVSGGIQITGSTADYQHSLDLTGYTLLDRWQKTVEFTAPTPDATTAIAIGTRSANTTAHFFNTAATVDLTNTATAGTVTINGGSGTAILATAPVKLVFAAGDKISITITRDFATFTVRVVNITTPMADVSATYTWTNFTTMQNTGTFSIFARSATPINVTKVSVFSKSQQNAIAVLGDSKGAGGTSTQWSNTMTGILQQNYPVVNVAGGSDATADMLLHLPEVIALKPRVVLLVGPGRNDKSYGVSDATIMANIATIVNTFTTAGITVYITTGFYETTIDMSTINASIKSTYPLITIDTYAATAADLSSSDAIHQKDIGNSIGAKVVLESGIFSKISAIRPILNMTDFINMTGLNPINGGVVYGNNGAMVQDTTALYINPTTKNVYIGNDHTTTSVLNINKSYATPVVTSGVNLNFLQSSNGGAISGLNLRVEHSGATGNTISGLNVTTIKDGTTSIPIVANTFITRAGARATSSIAVRNKGIFSYIYGSSALTSVATNQTYIASDNEANSTTAVGEGGTVIAVRGKATGLVTHSVVGGLFAATGGVTNDAIDDSVGTVRIRQLVSTVLKTDANGRIVTAVANTDYIAPTRTITTTSPLTGGGDLSANRTFGLAGLTGLGTANQIVGMNAAATAYEYKTVTAGSGVSIAQGVGSVTISATGNPIVEITGTTQTAAANTIYIPHNAAVTTISIPTTTVIGSLYQVIGEGAGGWKFLFAAGQTAKGVGVTTTSGGSIASTDRYCTLTIRLVAANTFVITTSQGTLTPL